MGPKCRSSLEIWTIHNPKWILMASYRVQLHSSTALKDWLAAVKKETSRSRKVWNWCILLWVTYPSRPQKCFFSLKHSLLPVASFIYKSSLTVYSMATLHAMSGQIKVFRGLVFNKPPQSRWRHLLGSFWDKLVPYLIPFFNQQRTFLLVTL